MNNDEVLSTMNALVATNLRLKAVQKAELEEISLLKKKLIYFNYENNGKRFICKGACGTAIAEGKQMTFIKTNSKIKKEIYFSSNTKAVLAALQAVTN